MLWGSETHSYTPDFLLDGLKLDFEDCCYPSLEKDGISGFGSKPVNGGGLQLRLDNGIPKFTPLIPTKKMITYNEEEEEKEDSSIKKDIKKKDKGWIKSIEALNTPMLKDISLPIRDPLDFTREDSIMVDAARKGDMGKLRGLMGGGLKN